MLLHEVKLEQEKERVVTSRQVFNNIQAITVSGVQNETVSVTVYARGEPYSVKVPPKLSLSFSFEGPIDGWLQLR